MQIYSCRLSPQQHKMLSFPEQLFSGKNDQVSTSWRYIQRQENHVCFEESLTSIVGYIKSRLTNLGKLIHSNICLGSQGSVQGWRHLTFILKEPLWITDRCTEFHPKLRPRAMLPGHKLLLPDSSWCYFWRSCGLAIQSTCWSVSKSVLWGPASITVNQQSFHFMTRLMSQVDMLPW